jgi:hypothetical protein
MSRLIHETYPDRAAAEAAVDRLASLGYGPGEVSVVMSSQTREQYGSTPAAIDASHVGHAATGGGVIGAAMGAILATATVAGATAATVVTGGLAAPFIAGPLAAALGGAVGGSAIGALVGAAGSEEEQEALDKDINGGGIVVAVQAREGDRDAVQAALEGTELASTRI